MSHGDRGDTKAMEQMTQVQKRTFTRWVNHFLSERMMKVEDLFTGLNDGTYLINLLEVISSKNLGKYDKKPKLDIHKIGNLNIAIEFIKSEGLKLVNIGADDILVGTPHLVLGLIWTLILRYQIQMGGGGSAKQELLDWVNKQIKPYEHIPQATDFTGSWQSGKILAALADSIRPGMIDTKSLNNPMGDVQNALDLALKNFSIPQLIDADDMVNKPDEHSNMTYIALYRDYLENKAKNKDLYKVKGPHPDFSFAKGKGVEGEKSFAGRVLPFTVFERNASDQPVTGKWIRPIEVIVTSPEGKQIPVEVKNNEDGSFACKYTTPVSGKHHIDVKIVPDPDGDDGPTDKQPIKGSQYTLNVRDPADPSKSWAEGPGLLQAIDDKPSHFTVFCRDHNDKPVPNEVVQVTVTQIEVSPDAGKPLQENVPVEVKDNGDGSYAVKYDANVIGKYRIDAKVGVPGASIKDMPKVIACVRAFDAKQTTAEGPGVTSGAPRVGLEAPFVVKVRDNKGKPVTMGGHDIKVNVKGPAGAVAAVVTDNKNGEYQVVYTPTAAGDHVVEVAINGEQIKDAPFHVAIKKPADPTKSYAEGPGLEQAWDNKPAKFKVYAKDEDGKAVSGEPVEVKVANLDGKDDVPVNVVDNGDGTYDVSYLCAKPGNYQIDTLIRGKHIKDMPKNVVCHKSPDPSKTTVTGPGVEGGFAGRNLPFTISSIDRDGQPVKVGGAAFTATVNGPSGPVPVELKDNKDGTYTGSYKPLAPGKYDVQVLLDGKHPVGKSPYHVTVKPPADPKQSFARGRGWNEAYDGIPTLFTVFAKDAQGEPVSGEIVRVVMRRVTTPAEQQKIDAESAGLDDYLKAKKADEVKKAEAERKAKQAEAREQEAKEAHGAPPKKTWTDPEGDVAVDLRDNGDGSYLATYSAAVPGYYEIHATVGEEAQNIKESPKRVPVHVSMPKIVFWQHTYNQEKEQLAALKKQVQEYEAVLKQHNLLQ